MNKFIFSAVLSSLNIMIGGKLNINNTPMKSFIVTIYFLTFPYVYNLIFKKEVWFDLLKGIRTILFPEMCVVAPA